MYINHGKYFPTFIIKIFVTQIFIVKIFVVKIFVVQIFAVQIFVVRTQDNFLVENLSSADLNTYNIYL